MWTVPINTLEVGARLRVCMYYMMWTVPINTLEVEARLRVCMLYYYLNVDCPSDQAVMVPINPNKQLYKCGGKCGDTKCSALFLAAEDLTKHIDPTRMPQCRHVSTGNG